MTATFWINSYFKVALPAIGISAFNAGLAIHLTVGNYSSKLIVFVVFVLACLSKLAYAHLSSKENYLWFLGDDAKKSRLLIAYGKLLGVGVALGSPLMSVAQYGDTLTMVLAILTLSWIFLTEGYAFDRAVKANKIEQP